MSGCGQIGGWAVQKLFEGCAAMRNVDLSHCSRVGDDGKCLSNHSQPVNPTALDLSKHLVSAYSSCRWITGYAMCCSCAILVVRYT